MITDIRVSTLHVLLDEGEKVTHIARRLLMSPKTIRKYRDIEQLPSQMDHSARAYRTRVDPLERFWPEIEALLEHDRKLKPYAILQWLKEKYNRAQPPVVADSLRRTLERRIRQWKLRERVEQEVHFPQIHHPGDVLAFDFVVLNELSVTVAGRRFDHLMFHAVLTYSNWEHIHLCHSESFEAVSAGLQDALHHVGGVPRRIRCDSLSAAVKNLSSRKEFTTAYQDLLNHYEVGGHRINVCQRHENGDAESSHGHLKDAVDQALRLRGSRDFERVEDYLKFARDVVSRRNEPRNERLLEERALLEGVCCSVRIWPFRNGSKSSKTQ